MLDALTSKAEGWGETILGLSLKPEQIGFGHMAARAILMYLILIGLVRSAKKRFLGEAAAFDMILVIVLGSIAARALTGGATYFPSVLAMTLLVAMHWLFSYIGRESPWFSGLIKGHSTLIIVNGKIDQGALKGAHMSRDDLDQDLRQHGVRDPSSVAEARLERDGHLSFAPTRQADMSERHHALAGVVPRLWQQSPFP